MCPQCGRETPLLYRGALAYCSACNAPRVPLSATGLHLAGKPAKLGGTVAAAIGWLVMAGSIGIALILGAILQAIAPGAAVGWAVGGVVGAIGVAASLVLLMGGRFLQRTGARAQGDARRSAVFALAENQRGLLRVPLVAKALSLSPTDAEVFLTDLSRDPESGVTLEVDADGGIYYRFLEIASPLPWPAAGMPQANGPRITSSQTTGRSPHAPPDVRARVGGTEVRGPTEASAADPVLDELEASDVGDNGAKRARQVR